MRNHRFYLSLLIFQCLLVSFDSLVEDMLVVCCDFVELRFFVFLPIHLSLLSIGTAKPDAFLLSRLFVLNLDALAATEPL